MRKQLIIWIAIVGSILWLTKTIYAEAPQRTIDFAGLTWHVKSGCNMGPGPNCWSDSTDSVWVDGQGVHLKIREIDGQWHSADIFTTTCSDYGMHRFYLIGNLDLLDVNVIAAPFLYQDDTHEIDIEFARWGVPGNDNAQYALQPYDTPGNLYRFPTDLAGTYSTHYFDWQPNSVHFKSIHGHYTEPPSSGFLIDEWMYTGSSIPDNSGCMRVHFNLWQRVGLPPTDGQEVEIILAAADLPTAVPTNVHALTVEKSNLSPSRAPFLLFGSFLAFFTTIWLKKSPVVFKTDSDLY